MQYPRPKGKPSFNQTQGDGVSWARWTWNWITGCLHGCEYCYAREIALSSRSAKYYPAGFEPLFHPERLDAPLHTSVPRAHQGDPAWHRVFSGSQADNYGRWVPDEWIEQGHATMRAGPRHWQYILLTKFPARYVGLAMPDGAWIGTSVDEQKRVRIAEDAFRQLPADGMVRWLSLEPLREPLEFTDLSPWDWMVIGAQTSTRQPGGTGPAFAPPFEWVARITAQAREAGCAVHLKPNLLGRVNSQSPGMQLPDEYPAAVTRLNEQRGEHMNTVVTGTAHECSFPVQPPHGSMGAPGPCKRFGKTWDRAQAEDLLVEAVAAMEATEPPDSRGGYDYDTVTDLRRELTRSADTWQETAAPARTSAFPSVQWGGRAPKAGGREVDGRAWDQVPPVSHGPGVGPAQVPRVSATGKTAGNDRQD